MSIWGFIESRRALLAAIGSLRSDSAMEIGFRLKLIESLLEANAPGDAIPREDIMELADEAEVPFSEPRIFELLLSTGIVDQSEDGGFTLRGELDLEQLFPAQLGALATTVLLADLRSSLGSAGGELPTATMISPATCMETIARSSAWALELMHFALDNDLGGIPVFWVCRQDQHMPLMREIGSVTTVDTVTLWALAHRPASHLTSLTPEDDAAVAQMLGLITSLQHGGPGWDQGSIIADGGDEDLPGSLPPEAPELGVCPTVPGTAAAMTALCSTLHLGDGWGAHDELRDTIARSVIDAVSFLGRQQMPDGGWPFYRYEGDQYSVKPSLAAGAIASEALAIAIQSHVLDEPSFTTAVEVLAEHARWVMQGGQVDGGEAWWSADLSGDPTARDLTATAWAFRALLPIAGNQIPGVAELEVERRLAATAAFMTGQWEPDPDSFARVPMHVPRRTGPADDLFAWELPKDPLVGTLLLRYARRFDSDLIHRIWDQVTLSVAGSLGAEQHGHWHDFLMAREGNIRGVPANTRYNIELLLAYLQALADSLNALRSPLLPPIDGSET